MAWFESSRSKYVTVGVGSALLGFLAAWPVIGSAQDKKDVPAAPPAADLADQVRQLNVKVVRLEAALAKSAPAAGGGMPGMGSSAGGGSGGGTGEMKDDAMGGMGGKKMAMPMMDDDMDMMGMMGMGSMGGGKGKKMKMAAALPGFPGMSHLYHIGATDFFLDHPEHITLSVEQTTKLGQTKQKATTAKASAQRKVEEAEQQLWELTGADAPDAAQIEAKLREAEKLRGDQRMGFIRAVGEAAQALTDDQRKILLGQAQPAAHRPQSHPKTP